MSISLPYGRVSSLSSHRGAEAFPDPFADMASLYMPETINDALRWTEYIFMANGPYRSAVERVLSYFLTDVEIQGCGREEKQKYEDFLHNRLQIRNVLRVVGLDFLCYGNSFTSIMMPFRRYLMCRSCGFEAPLRQIYNNKQFGFRWAGFKFLATCPKCRYQGEWTRNDRRSGEESDIRVKRWSPHYMDILWDPYSDEVSYIWKIEEDYQRQLTSGFLFHLERADWKVVEAVQHGQALQFDKGVIYHMKEDALAGIRNRGWGLSRVLVNFRQAWYVQVLHRYNEAIALDYVIPFRVLTPMPRGGSGEAADPMAAINMSSFVGRVENMLRRRRQDPATWNVLPFPLQYQALGGDARQLAPYDLMEQGLDTLLSSIGIPVELYKGNLSLQTAPAALRLFEATWSHLVHGLNSFLQNLADRLSEMLGWEKVTVRLQRVTHADDLNRQMAKLQLMMGGQISQTTGLQSLGLSFEEEQRRLMDEQQFIAEEQQDAQEEMDQSAQMDQVAPRPGPMSASGAQQQDPNAAAGGAAGQVAGQQQNPPNVPTTPEELEAQATTEAQRVLALPEGQKDSELIKMKKNDSVLHSLVTTKIEEIRQQAKTQGGAQVMQQQFGKAANRRRIITGSVLDNPKPLVRTGRFLDF